MMQRRPSSFACILFCWYCYTVISLSACNEVSTDYSTPCPSTAPAANSRPSGGQQQVAGSKPGAAAVRRILAQDWVASLVGTNPHASKPGSSSSGSSSSSSGGSSSNSSSSADWMPAAGSQGSKPGISSGGSAGKTGAAAAGKADWLSGIAGPTAIITSPRTGQQITVTNNGKGVLFNGSTSTTPVGTTLVSYDWEVSGTRDDGLEFKTGFIGATRQVALPPGHYSVSLTVQAAQVVGSGESSFGSDFIARFSVKNNTAPGSSAGSPGSAAKAGTAKAGTAKAKAPNATGSAAGKAAAGSKASTKGGQPIMQQLQSKLHQQQQAKQPQQQQTKQQAKQQQQQRANLAGWELGAASSGTAASNHQAALSGQPSGPPSTFNTFASTTTGTVAPYLRNTAYAAGSSAASLEAGSISGSFGDSRYEDDPFSWAFDPVIDAANDQYGPSSALQRQQQQEEQERAQRLKQLEQMLATSPLPSSEDLAAKQQQQQPAVQPPAAAAPVPGAQTPSFPNGAATASAEPTPAAPASPVVPGVRDPNYPASGSSTTIVPSLPPPTPASPPPPPAYSQPITSPPPAIGSGVRMASPPPPPSPPSPPPPATTYSNPPLGPIVPTPTTGIVTRPPSPPPPPPVARPSPPPPPPPVRPPPPAVPVPVPVPSNTQHPDSDGDCYDDITDEPIDACTPSYNDNYDEDGNPKILDNNADCKDDSTGKAIPGCNAGAPSPTGEAPEVDDDYCLPWEEYDGDREAFEDCCYDAKDQNVQDSGCVAIGIKP